MERRVSQASSIATPFPQFSNDYFEAISNNSHTLENSATQPVISKAEVDAATNAIANWVASTRSTANNSRRTSNASSLSGRFQSGTRAPHNTLEKVSGSIHQVPAGPSGDGTTYEPIQRPPTRGRQSQGVEDGQGQERGRGMVSVESLDHVEDLKDQQEGRPDLANSKTQFPSKSARVKKKVGNFFRNIFCKGKC